MQGPLTMSRILVRRIHTLLDRAEVDVPALGERTLADRASQRLEFRRVLRRRVGGTLLNVLSKCVCCAMTGPSLRVHRDLLALAGPVVKRYQVPLLTVFAKLRHEPRPTMRVDRHDK